jgi:ribosome biogenesis protein Tsr3
MNRLAVALIGFFCATALTISAAEAKDKTKATAEQKALRKEMVNKYDTNKDGKLDKEERAKISKEDKEKMEKAGIGHKKKE